MRHEQSSWLWAALLIAAGCLLLLFNFDIIPMSAEVVFGLLFAAAGAVFLGVFLLNRSQWWALIPGSALLSLGALTGLSSRIPGSWGGALFLGGIGLGFWLIYLTQRMHWWPIIPGGALLTLATVAGSSDTVSEKAGGGVFFLGLGLTFVLVFLLGTPRDTTRWAIIPAAVLLIIGALLLMTESSLAGYLWPLILIGLGVYLLVRPRPTGGN